jgi:hypothetical protein
VIAIAVHNVHTRRIGADIDRVGALIDTLAGPDDRLWPVHDWMPMRLDGPLALGIRGSHGPARYRVVGYQPGRWVRFAMLGPGFLRGFHEFSVHPSGDSGATELHHTLALKLGVLGWPIYPLVFKPLHDTVIEQALDSAELAVHGSLARPAARTGRWFRVLRALMTRYVRILDQRR